MDFPLTLIKILRNTPHIVVLTGAGVSAESGIPTFREAQTGLWAQYNPEDLATPSAFRQNPKLVWEWYAWRRTLIQKAAPNPGHFALASMENLAEAFTLITQNVDGMHQRAGSQNVIELHGNILRTRCTSEGTVFEELPMPSTLPPICRQCGSLLRPDVVWFGEQLPEIALGQASRAAQGAAVFFSIGTSAFVHPAASLPIYAAEAGALVVEINPNPTPITQIAAHSLCGPAGEILPALCKRTWPDKFEDSP
jgi:NAD-dependent deacetylase